MSNYISFRYTLDPAIPIKHYVETFATTYVSLLRPTCFTMGLESLDKYGEPANPHIHLNFQTDDKVDSIRQRLRRYWKSVDEKREGNSLYSLKTVIPEDRIRFYRYPLKQGAITFDNEMILPSDFDLENERKLAYHEWSQGIIYNKQIRDRMEAKSGKYDKIAKYLDELKVSSKIEVQRGVINFYKNEKLSCNFKNMQGYVNTYMLLKGWLSEDECIKYMEKYN